MKVLLVIEPGVDGVFRHVEGLTHYLLEHDVELHLAYSSVRGSDRLHDLVKLVESHGGETSDLHTSNHPQWADFKAFGVLSRLARRHQFHIVHCHSSKAGVLGRALRLVGIRGAMFYTPNAYHGMNSRNQASRIFFNFIESIFGYVGTTIHVSSDESQFARDVLRLAPWRQKLIPNWVDPKIFRPATPEEKRAAREVLGVPQEAFVIGTLGRLSFQKDPETLYRAFAIAARTHPEIKLLHVGDGELREDLNALVAELGLEDRLIRLTYLREPVRFYQAIDAFMLTSRYEGLSYAVLEALACGAPILLTDAPGNRDFARLGLSHFWTAAVSDHEAFALRLGEFLADRAAARPSNHHAKAVELFNPEVCCGNILQTYRDAVARVSPERVEVPNLDHLLPSDPARPILSIIIVTYRSLRDLPNCLASIPRTLLDREVEVIVVENDSNDGVLEFVTANYPWVQARHAGGNLGFSKANNLGFDFAHGENILFLNPDTVVNAAALEHCLLRLQTEREIGIISPKLVMADGEMDLACRRSIPSTWDGLTRATGLARRFPDSRFCAGYNLTYLPDDATYEVGAVNGAFMMIPRRVLVRMGLFDEQFFMYGEDLDLCLRASLAGYKVVYDGRQSIVHLKGQSSTSEFETMSKAVFTGSKQFYLKHFNPRDSQLVAAKYGLLFWFWESLSAAVARAKGHKKAQPV